MTSASVARLALRSEAVRPAASCAGSGAAGHAISFHYGLPNQRDKT